MLKINEFFFNDHLLDTPAAYERWQPEDESLIDEWVKVLVGPESGGGHWYQIHICNERALHNIRNKKHIYKIEGWESVDKLIEELESYVNNLFPEIEDNNQKYVELSKYWLWEYAKNS